MVAARYHFEFVGGLGSAESVRVLTQRSLRPRLRRRVEHLWALGLDADDQHKRREGGSSWGSAGVSETVGGMMLLLS